MERKRIKGRFAAEDKTDKGGVVKNQATAPAAEQAAPPNRAKSLVGSLLDKWKQRSRTNAAH
jgi:hypothetical protein